MKSRALRIWLRKWHRKTGIFAAIIICLVTFSGILLNHIGELSLDKQYPQNSLVLFPYRSVLNSPEQTVITTFDWQQSQYQMNSGKLERGDDVLASDCGRIRSMAATDTELLVACEYQWLLISPAGLLLDIFEPSFFDVPERYQLFADEQFFYWRMKDELTQAAKIDFLNYQSILVEPTINEFQSISNIQFDRRNRQISWQRVLLDLHSGRWFGSYGIWIVDIAALMLLFLALSGSWIWFNRR